MFPALYDQIQQGAEATTTANASMEKLGRLDAVSAMGGMTADNSLANPTYSEVLDAANVVRQKGDKAFAARMKAAFPDGLKISMIGDLVVDIRSANLVKEWSHCALFTNQGVYCNALANTAVALTPGLIA